METEEWTTEQAHRHEYVLEPFLRIAKIDFTGRSRIYFNQPAYKAIGSPEYVQILLKSNDMGHMIKLVPSARGIKNARPMRTTTKGIVVLGGAASLVKKYKMPYGYYILDDKGVFTWKYQ